MLRLGATEKGITELVAIGEHVAGLAVAASGFRLEQDSLVREPAQGNGGDPRERQVDDAIRSWTRENLDLDGLPAYWDLLRDEPKFREAHWRTHQLVLGDGEIDLKAKGLIAYAVACFRSSPYWVEYFTRYCRAALGVNGTELRETVLAGMHSASYNTAAHGMMLGRRYTDMRAEEFHKDGEVLG